jgi:hypothetical protein
VRKIGGVGNATAPDPRFDFGDGLKCGDADYP